MRIVENTYANAEYPQCVFDAKNVIEKPKESKFFLGETVLHRGNKQFYTVCSLNNYEEGFYGLWPLGFVSAMPTHGCEGEYLESIVTD